METVAITDESLLRRSQLFRGIEPPDVDAIVEHFVIHDRPAGHVIYHQDETAPTALYVLLDGRVSISRRTDAGRGRGELIGPGETFGELSVLDPGPRERTATTLTPSRVASLAGEAFIGWARDRPYVAQRLLRVLARRLRRTDDDALDLLFVDVGARLAKVLCDLAKRFGQPMASGLLVDHGLSQQQLAEMVGTSRETLNKQLHGFAARGWLTAGRGLVVIRDHEALARRAAMSEA